MMSWQKKQVQTLVRTLLCFLLFTLLFGCGGTGTVVPSTPTTIAPLGTVIDKNDSVGLHIEADPVNCHFDYWFGLYFRGNLVLNENHPNNYEIPELQQIESYSQRIYDRKLKLTDSIPTTLITASQGGSGCGSGLSLTNTSQTTIQVLSISMRLIAAPKPNSGSYHLIDICSLLSVSEKAGCPGLFGGGNPFGYSFQLKQSPVGTIFQPQGSSGSYSLQPNEVVSFSFTFTPTGTPDNFIYDVVPELILNTGIFELKAMTMELSFADRNQFTCMQVSKKTFVSEAPIPPRYLPDGSPSGHWCV